MAPEQHTRVPYMLIMGRDVTAANTIPGSGDLPTSAAVAGNAPCVRRHFPSDTRASTRVGRDVRIEGVTPTGLAGHSSHNAGVRGGTRRLLPVDS